MKKVSRSLLGIFAITLLSVALVNCSSSKKKSAVDTTPTAAPTITSFTPTSGPVGTEVTITGTNFDITAADNYVNFNHGATDAVINSATATEIKCVVPADATTGPIDVFTWFGGANGTTVTSTQTFTVTASTVPTITSFTPSFGPVGTSVVITGTLFATTAANNTVKFNGTTAATPTSVSATSLTVVVPAGATSGPITVTTAGGTGTSLSNFTVGTSASTSPFAAADLDASGYYWFNSLTTAPNYISGTSVNGTTATNLDIADNTALTGSQFITGKANSLSSLIQVQTAFLVDSTKVSGDTNVGALVITKCGSANAADYPTAGSITIKLQSCSQFFITYVATGSIYYKIETSSDGTTFTSKYATASGSALHSKGFYTADDISSYVTSTSPIWIRITNGGTGGLSIHAMKIVL
jgi:hypothetical protein